MARGWGCRARRRKPGPEGTIDAIMYVETSLILDTRGRATNLHPNASQAPDKRVVSSNRARAGADCPKRPPLAKPPLAEYRHRARGKVRRAREQLGGGGGRPSGTGY